jgi:alcohol dehydrogenase/L-iditol 2-dehydrogenase
MRAALLIEPGRLEVGEVPRPEPGPGEVRIAVAGIGLCGSDQHVARGTWTVPAYPWIPGHEGYGVIDAVGPEVDEARLGETVVIEPNIPCLDCPACRRGWTSACQARKSVGMNRPGAIAESVVVPSANAWPAPSLDPRDLVSAEPLAVVEAALRRMRAPLPASALVVGVGAQGMLMTVALQHRGVDVAVVDPNAGRVAHAVGLGAAALDDDVEATFALIVDTVGAPDVVATIRRRAEIGATVIELALSDHEMPFTSQMLVRRQLVVQGSLTYDHPADFRSTLRSIEQGLAPGRVVTDVFDLDDVAEAFRVAPSAPGKTWVRVGPGPAGQASVADALTAARRPRR